MYPHGTEDTIEQSMCRLRTDEEQRAVEACILIREFLSAGAREMRLDSDYRPYDLD